MKKLAGVSFVALLLVAWTYAPAPVGELVQFEGGPFYAAGVISCTGEFAEGEQSYKGHYKYTFLKDGGIRYNYHYQYQLDLVGTSGRKYNGQGVTNENWKLFPGEIIYVRTHNKLIAQGEDGGDDDFHFYETFRLQVMPDGTLKKLDSDIKIECR